MNLISINQTDNNLQMKILIFGIIEMFIGFSGAILADFSSIFNLLTFLSGMAGVIALFFCILQPGKIKVYDLMGMAIVLAYGTGTLNSLVSYSLDGLDLLKGSTVDEYWLSRTLGLATAAAGLMHVVGRFDNASSIFHKFDQVTDQHGRMLWLSIITFGFALFFIATGKIGFMADVRISKLYININPITSIITELLLPVGALAFHLGIKEESVKRKYVLIGMAILMLLIQFGFGRRIFSFSAIIYLMIFFFSTDQRKLLSLRTIAIFAFITITFQITNTVFSVMRIASYSYKQPQNNPTIFEMVPDALDIYEHRERINLDEIIHKNLSSRTFVLEYLAKLEKATSTIEPTYGENILRSLVVSTPGFLYPSKYKNKLFIQAEEVLFDRNFRLTSMDEGNTFLTAGVGDFGIFGLFAMPLFICLIFSSVLKILNRLISPVRCSLISLFICYSVISVEKDLTGFFTSIRTIMIILFISWVFFNFNIKNNKSMMRS